MIKAVLFDMDGVLYDSMPLHAKAWSQAMEEVGIDADITDFYLFEGRTGASTINILFNRAFGRDATPEDIDTIYKQKVNLFNRLGDGKAVIMPGAMEVLQKVKALGHEIVLVTGSGQESLINKLQKDFPGYFTPDKIVTAFDVEHGKPHPEPYLMGLEKANVQPEEAIVIENAPLGIESARAAGIYTIAVNTGPLPDNVLWEAGANALYHSMMEIAEKQLSVNSKQLSSECL